jgi:hypothetical protein
MTWAISLLVLGNRFQTVGVFCRSIPLYKLFLFFLTHYFFPLLFHVLPVVFSCRGELIGIFVFFFFLSDCILATTCSGMIDDVGLSAFIMCCGLFFLPFYFVIAGFSFARG